MMTSKSDYEHLKQCVNLRTVVSEYVPLKRKTRHDWIGLCPFHQEKTPSFIVHEDRQFYKCFGCGVGGDAITFLQEIGGLTFQQAIEDLTQRAGISFQSKRESERMQRARERAKMERWRFLWWRDSYIVGVRAALNVNLAVERKCTEIVLSYTKNPPTSDDDMKLYTLALDAGMDAHRAIEALTETLDSLSALSLEQFAEVWKAHREAFKPQPWQPLVEQIRKHLAAAGQSKTLGDGFLKLLHAEKILSQIQSQVSTHEFRVIQAMI